MKTIADFKRKLQVGNKVHTIFHAATKKDENGKLIFWDEDKGEREISIVQSNSFALKTAHKDGKIVDSWCSYPKAAEFKVIDENTVQILEQDFRLPSHERSAAPLIPVLTYKFIN